MASKKSKTPILDLLLLDSNRLYEAKVCNQDAPYSIYFESLELDKKLKDIEEELKIKKKN